MNNDLHYSMPVEAQRNSIGRLQYLSWGEFTGVVNIKAGSGQAWEIVFYQGQIVWSLDLAQPNRLWHRLLQTHVADDRVTLESLVRSPNSPLWTGLGREHNTCWYYQGAISLLESSEINLSQVMAILTTAAEETIFDLLQYSQSQTLTFRSHSEIFVDRPPIVVDPDGVIARSEALWQEWHQQKLGSISPNKTPVIEHPVQLYRETTPIIYQNLVRVITGKHTLREIVSEIYEDLLLFTRSLTRYIQTGIIKLIDLPDSMPKIGSELSSPKKDRSIPTIRSSLSTIPKSSKPTVGAIHELPLPLVSTAIDIE
jgi:two-component system, chemotaxis family, response regulator PixG